MDIACSYQLGGITYLTLSHFGDFWRIPYTESATAAATATEGTRRLLEPLPRVTKRSARQIRSHAANTGASTSQRMLTLAERLDPNRRNATPPSESTNNDNDTQLARRNSEA